MRQILLSVLLACAAHSAWAADAASVAAPAAAPAQAAPATPQSELPVEVNADSLEVLQQEQKAIFRGNVIAIQGDMRLQSDTMIVHYRKKDEQPAAKPAPAAPGVPAETQNTIQRIEAEGHVVLSTPKESATGDKGLYEVEKRELYLDNNVVLTQDQSVLKGAHLVYNLDTGRSRLESQTGTSDARVRGLFVPEKEEKK